MSAEGVLRVVRTARPVPLGAVVGIFRRGAGDPTSRRDDGGWWFAWRTPDGPVTLRLTAPGGASDEVTARAWGSGTDWMLEQVPALLGEDDDASGFDASLHPLVAQEWRRRPGWRVPRSGLVVQNLVPSVIEQKVTGKEAFAGYRRLVRRFGEPAPGPGEELGLAVAPTPAGWASVPSWEWLAAGVDPQRSRTVAAAVRYAGRLEECVGMPVEAARARITALPGIGRWTWAEVAQRALGLPDEVSFGDYHVAKDMTWALTGTPQDDDALAELLEPWRGHRYRVQRLLELGGHHRPRRGPRMTLPTHLPTRGR
ncbi:DNA-3-methyladenine glycosylase 2 family protein [Phycicoccus sp. MAQZ13P-2]|uniref:DNA-3-methyladenine glycosylase family protein n=1 Tax=Phycicoccus mangrovi TaxID=2840470 RepID=UPI001C00201B|nr:DNA-3-methyladenine glycosylase 2 family protein [Phycicoccus mangrovi]MBT9255940.1 DNA-3-methyladenine glycosylase 2 family protein [Phycicoccus mangrovi]MBT9274534.1 DNA-3-methyladenine glycosylase 2 family protein [Phycicoccus mangrovi]